MSQSYKFCDSSHRLSWPNFYLIQTQQSIISKIWSSQSHLDSYIDFASTWLYPKIFHHCIRNTDCLALKYCELLASYLVISDQRDTYIHIFCEILLTAEYSAVGLSFVQMYSYILTACHSSVFTLFGYEDNQSIWHTTIYTW